MLDVRRVNTKTNAQTTYLNAEVTSVDIVTQKEIARCLGISADLEELHQIVLYNRAHISGCL